MAGDRKAGAAQRLLPVVAHGLAVASVSYRFSDVATHPAQLEDARDAIDWLVAHAAQLGLRAGPVGVWGASAGGWIALMQGLGGHVASSDAVAATCAWFPVTDLLTNIPDRDAAGLPLPPVMTGRSLPTPSMEARLLGVGDVRDAPELARRASPVSYAEQARGPVLLMHGDRDGLVHHAQSARLHAALRRAHQEAELLLIAGADHQDPAFERPAVLGAVAAFFTATLR
jgi:acetyl esterase/lipase